MHAGRPLTYGAVCALIFSAIYLGFTVTRELPPPRWVKVWGGAVTGTTPIVLRFERGSREPGFSGRVELRRASGKLEVARLTFDEEDAGFVTFAPGDLIGARLRVLDGQRTVVEGRLLIPGEPFDRQLTFHSGAIQGRVKGPDSFDVRLGEGRLVFGRIGSLEVRFHGATSPVSALTLSLEGDGLSVLSSPEGGRRSAGDWQRFLVQPTASLVSIRVLAKLGDSPPSEFTADVAVESAQFWGQRRGESVEVESLLPVASLYYALVSEQGVWARGRAVLEERPSAGRVTRVARVAKVGDVPGRSWLVVGREPALDGASAIGWPLDEPIDTERATVRMRDRLLLDGKSTALREYERLRSERARHVLLGVATVGVAFLLVVAALLRRSEGDALYVPRESRRSVVALFVGLALAFLALGVWAMLRLSAN